MSRPPEYEQVALWLRAINNDPELLRELASEFSDIGYASEDGLTRDRYIGERRQILAERGWRALGGIGLDGKSTAQISGEYHAGQIAECAHLVRDLEERIRALDTGDFPVPAWCPEDAARDGISLTEAIERYRQDEIYAAAQALDHMDEYAVADHEIQAYWAGRDGRADYECPDDGKPARAAGSAAQAAASSPGAATGITGLPSHTSLDFPKTVTHGVPARSAVPGRPASRPGWPAARRTR